jgi:predicted SprT family Zn-dependent metalloprotease
MCRSSESDSPTKKQQAKKLVTPPSTPPKVALPSPSKTKGRIPPSPHRESTDAFWSQEVTNDWNDSFSPRKEARTPGRALERILRAMGEDVVENEEDDSPCPAADSKGPKSPSKTALKKAEAARKKAMLERKKSFDNKKAGLAEEFLKHLDGRASDGQVQKMAEGTGGIKVIWSKTLNTTAGRANWKRVKMEPRGSSDELKIQHHASIELAEKIIDSEDRLLNTLAHEYCHLANFMISGIRDNPHGASFKEWGRKCMAALKDHPVYGGRVEITTKHSYKIDYKYVWICVDCGYEYGRHSKSIDPTKARCGRCKGLLQQIKPKPRNVSPKKKSNDGSGSESSVSSKKIDDVTRSVGKVSLGD